MNVKHFQSLVSQGFNRIPVTREVLADLETPVSTYLKLARGPYSYLFESVLGGEKWGRYSMIGLPAVARIEVVGGVVYEYVGSNLVDSHHPEDPLAYIEQYHQRHKVPELEELPRFTGGLVGYFGYDTVRYIEPRLQETTPADPVGTPDILLTVSDEVVVFDNLNGKMTLVVHADPEVGDALAKAEARLDVLESLLKNARVELPPMGTEPGGYGSEALFESQFGKTQFLEAVAKIKEYTLAGDIMQAVIAQRLSIPFDDDPLNLYRALRCLNPSPYMYFMDLGDHQVVGSSPEILVRLEHGELTVRPIAGTRRRGRTEEEDRELEQELVNDPKEIAEHLMLIDLGRNDVGRVSETGSVCLSEKMVVERFSHVMHITSNVTGQLKPGLTAMDAFKAAFPAGTLSGAPKIRAMEILDELEPVKRGIYGGAIGYLAWNGNMDTAIAIRTAVVKDGYLHAQAGAGVVADSVPELEWKETMNKARAIFSAVDMVKAYR